MVARARLLLAIMANANFARGENLPSDRELRAQFVVDAAPIFYCRQEIGEASFRVKPLLLVERSR